MALEYNLSGRAHFLIRKFLETGWLEREPDAQSFMEQFIVPVYASKMLNLFFDLVSGKTTEQVEVKEILAEHFDIFRQQISDKIYHPSSR